MKDLTRDQLGKILAALQLQVLVILKLLIHFTLDYLNTYQMRIKE